MARILVCEHDFLDRSELIRVLSSFGQCDAVTDAEECLEAFAAALAGDAPYDLVTLDRRSITDTDTRLLLESLRALEAGGEASRTSRVLLTHVDASQVDPGLGDLECLCDGRLGMPADVNEVQEQLRAIGLSC